MGQSSFSRHGMHGDSPSPGSGTAHGDGASSQPASAMLSLVAFGQAFFYIVTGIWPLLSMATFEAVTGPKTDDWLVKTVGVLVLVVVVVLGLAALRRRITPEITLLAVGCALGLAAIDVVYVTQRVIGAIYLLDAVAELLLVALWVAAWVAATRRTPGGDPETQRNSTEAT